MKQSCYQTCVSCTWVVCLLVLALPASSGGNIRGTGSELVRHGSADVDNESGVEQPERAFREVSKLHADLKRQVKISQYSMSPVSGKLMQAKRLVQSRGSEVSQVLIDNITSLQIHALQQHVEKAVLDKLKPVSEFDDEKQTTKNATAELDAKIDKLEAFLNIVTNVATQCLGSVQAGCQKKLASVLMRLEEQLRNTDVNTAEARTSLSKVSQLRSEIQSILDFETAHTKVLDVTISGITKITRSLYSSIRSGIKASMATYFNLRDKDVSVSDATAIQATSFIAVSDAKSSSRSPSFKYTVRMSVSSIALPIFNAKMKALIGPPSAAIGSFISSVAKSVTAKEPNLGPDISQMSSKFTIKGVGADTEIDKFGQKTKSLSNELLLTYVSEMKLNKNKLSSQDAPRNNGKFEPLTATQLQTFIMNFSPSDDVDSLMAYSAIACRRLSKLQGKELELAEKKCNSFRHKLIQKLRQEKRNTLPKTNEDSQMKAEKEAEADLKIVEKEEKRASAAVGKDEEENLRESKELSEQSINENEAEDAARSSEAEEEKVAKEHHDLIEARKRLQDTIRAALADGGAASVQKLRLKLKNIISKIAGVEKQLADVQRKNQAAQERLQAQRTKLQDAKNRMKKIMLKERKEKERMRILDEKRQKKIKELIELKGNMHEKILELKRDTAKLESEIQSGAGVPGAPNSLDSTEIADQQAYAKQKIEDMVKGFSNVVLAKMQSKPVPAPLPPSPVPAAPVKPNQINIVVGCGNNCQKEKKPAKVDTTNVDASGKPELVNKVVKSAMKDVLRDKQEDEVDRLERRRIELEHDERIQENASRDVKNALEAAREAKDKVMMLNAELSSARNTNAEKKAELYSEVMTRDAKKKALQEREQHAKDLALSEASS